MKPRAAQVRYDNAASGLSADDVQAAIDELAAAVADSGGAGELLMQDGVTSPPVPVENEAGDDWLYEG